MAAQDPARQRGHVRPAQSTRFGNRRISQITTMDVEAWRAEQRAAVKPKTKGKPEAPDVYNSQSSIRTRYALVASVFKYALSLRWIAVYPCSPGRAPKVPHHELTFRTPEQVAAGVEYLDEHSASDGLIVPFAAYTGLRAEELEGLRIGDVNLFARRPFIRVQRQAHYAPKVGREYISPKSNKSIRNVPLNPCPRGSRTGGYLTHHPNAHDADALPSPGASVAARARRAARSTGVPSSTTTTFTGSAASSQSSPRCTPPRCAGTTSAASTPAREPAPACLSSASPSSWGTLTSPQCTSTTCTRSTTWTAWQPRRVVVPWHGSALGTTLERTGCEPLDKRYREQDSGLCFGLRRLPIAVASVTTLLADPQRLCHLQRHIRIGRR